MVLKETLIYLAIFAASIQAGPNQRIFDNFSGQNWYNFRMGFSLNPTNGFNQQPRTTDEAIAAGWQQISNDCSEGAM